MEGFTISEQYKESIKLDEYNGTFSVILVREGKDGKIYPQWCKRKFGEKEVNRPVGLTLGGKEQVKEFAEWLLLEVVDEEAKEEFGTEEPPF